MSPLPLTTQERSSRFLLLDQELVVHHVPGSATPQTLILLCGRTLMVLHWNPKRGLQLRPNCSPELLVLVFLCLVDPHGTVLMENTAVWGLLPMREDVSPSVSIILCWLICPILTHPSHAAPCPTLSLVSNGMISYNRFTNMATYSCITGYTVTGTSSSITCNEGTMQWSSTQRPTCERKQL